MQSWKTIVVIILLVIVGGYAYYISRNPAPSQTPNLYSLKSADIQKIELRSPGRDILLERAKGGWRLVKPVAVVADATTVDSMADAIASLQITSTIKERPGDLAPFGLRDPAVKVIVTTKDNRVLPAIMVGKDTPVGNSSYIMSPQHPGILLVSSGFPPAVEKSVDDLRSRTLIGFKPGKIDKVLLDTANAHPLELEKTGDQWSIVSPRRYAADNIAVRSLLESITNARVADFIDDQPSDLAKYGLANPSFKLVVDGGEGHAQESLLFGFTQSEADKAAIYARRGEGVDQPVVTVDNYVFNQLDKSFDDLRNKTVLPLATSDVSRVIISAGKFYETVERAPGDKWNVIVNDKSTPAERLVADSFVDQLHDLTATKIVEDPMTNPQHYGMVKPTVTMGVYAKDGKKIGTLRLSSLEMIVKPKPGTVAAQNVKPRINYLAYATTSNSSAVYQIPVQAVTDFENTITRLHSDAVKRVSTDAVQKPGEPAKSQPSPAPSSPAAHPH